MGNFELVLVIVRPQKFQLVPEWRLKVSLETTDNLQRHASWPKRLLGRVNLKKKNKKSFDCSKTAKTIILKKKIQTFGRSQYFSRNPLEFAEKWNE